MPSIFAIANPKGGSGKTTVAIILAGEFAKHAYSVAIVDADPQGSSYQWHASSVDSEVKMARVPSPISFSTSPRLSCTAEITASA